MNAVLLLHFFDSFVAIGSVIYLCLRLFSMRISKLHGWLLVFYAIASIICIMWMTLWLMHWGGLKVGHLGVAIEPMIVLLRYMCVIAYSAWIYCLWRNLHA